MLTDHAEKALLTNRDYYSTFWRRRWKSRLMFDTQIKKRTFLFALTYAGIQRVNKKVLDIGFGSGDILFTFDASCELYGVDLSEQAVEEARRYAKRKGYKESQFLQLDLDGRNLPFMDGGFDLVVCSHVLEHVVDDDKVLIELRRVLRDDGTGVILIPINEQLGYDPNHVRTFTTQEFVSHLERLGFQVTFVHENEYVGHLTSWFFLRRYHKRIPLIGFLISALINLPLALLPLGIHALFDSVLRVLGYKPRQAVCCVSKSVYAIKSAAGT